MSDQREEAIGLMSQRRFSEALPIFLQLAEDNPDDWSIYYMSGQCFRFTNNVPEAIKCLTKAAMLNPTDPQILLALGIALQLAEEYESAIAKLKEVVRLDPRCFSAYNSIGLTYRKTGQFREAYEWYSKALEGLVTAVSDDVYRDRESCFREEIVDGKKTLVVLPYAMEKIQEVLCSEPTHAMIKNNMGVCLLELGEQNSAREQFRESIEFVPDGYNYPDPLEHLESIGG